MNNLWSANHPASFWLCGPEVAPNEWTGAIQRSFPILGLQRQPEDVDDLLALILGEAQFGTQRWQLSQTKRLYYLLKPLMPRRLTSRLRRLHSPYARSRFALGWPIEDRYARFQWEVLRQVLRSTGRQSIDYRAFWPERKQFALVLTHDVESEDGQEIVRSVADLDESFGFRSSFNFVMERYPLDYRLISDLRKRGFEIGIHGVKHDGKYYYSQAEFARRSHRINGYLKELGSVGFRSPLMMRNPEWLQSLDIEYDLSFFDADPFEPMPGGTMTIWPFTIGRFVELPYTLAQDFTLTSVLGEMTARLWIEKVDFIERYRGMALLNTHPDYLRRPLDRKIYADFLGEMKRRDGYWNALPKDVAHWWRARTADVPGTINPCPARACISEQDGALELC